MDLLKTIFRVVTILLLLAGLLYGKGGEETVTRTAEIRLTLPSGSMNQSMVIRVVIPDGEQRINVEAWPVEDTPDSSKIASLKER